jgi:hypothetical protein
MMPASTAQWDDLSIESQLDSSRLPKIIIELELVTIAVVALAQIDRLEIWQTAQELQVESMAIEWLHEWPDLQSPPTKPIDFPQIQARIAIVSHLAHKYQTVVRQNMNYWQQIVQVDRLPLESPALADYMGNFIKIYQTRLGAETMPSLEALSQAALNLLIELLFYGNTSGNHRLWGTLLQRSHSTDTPPKPT